jgi:hypothetical protein
VPGNGDPQDLGCARSKELEEGEWLVMGAMLALLQEAGREGIKMRRRKGEGSKHVMGVLGRAACVDILWLLGLVGV